MRSVYLLFAVLSLSACAQSRSPADVERSMKEELSHAIVLEEDALVAMNTELSHAIGTTVVTNAVVAGPAMEASEGMALPEDRMSLSGLAPQTWGDPGELDVPDTRD